MKEPDVVSIEIFGAPGVGKSTFIREKGLLSSQDVYLRELDTIIKNDLRRNLFLPLPAKFIRMFRSGIQSKYDERGYDVFEREHKEFLDLCLFIIFNSPVSAERKIRCHKFLTNAVLSRWFVKEREGMIWDESFAKLVLYACGMNPGFSDQYFPEIVRIMPKRGKYIYLDGTPEQGVYGQVKRGKFKQNLSMDENESKLRSAEKYRNVAERLYVELINNGFEVEKHMSTLDIEK